MTRGCHPHAPVVEEVIGVRRSQLRDERRQAALPGAAALLLRELQRRVRASVTTGVRARVGHMFKAKVGVRVGFSCVHELQRRVKVAGLV